MPWLRTSESLVCTPFLRNIVVFNFLQSCSPKCSHGDSANTVGLEMARELELEL